MRFFFLFVLISYTLFASGQNCKDYYYFDQDMKVEFSGARMYQKGKKMEADSMNFTLEFEEIGTTKDECMSRLIQKIPTNKKRTKGIEMVFNYLMSGDTLKMPINNWMGFFSKQRSHVKTDKLNDELFVVYPEGLSVGQIFDDMKGRKTGYDGDGYEVTMTIEIKNRKVEKKETLTTPAGVWEAYKITFDYKLIGDVAPGARGFSGGSFKFKWEEWFVPKLGVIKTNLYMNEALVTSYSLSSITK